MSSIDTVGFEKEVSMRKPSSLRQKQVLVFTAGGLEHGGGIGRMIGYMCEAWPAAANWPKPEVVDTRGPARKATAPVFFAKAILRLIVAGLTVRPLVHIHIAGRGSSLRKGILVGVARLFGLQVVLHQHDFDYRRFLSKLPKPVVSLLRWTFQAAEAVVVLGEADRRTATEILGVSPDRVMIVANAVPAPRLAKQPRQASEAVRLVFLGDPSRRKGVHDLLDALSHPLLTEAEGAPDWRATIAGGGGELEGFRGTAIELGLEDRVSFPGWVNQEGAQALLAASDVLILPSYGEGMAMSVLEAMSFGLAIVCTPVGALAEVIEDGSTGLLIQPGDVNGLAHALRRVLDDQDLRHRLGQAAQARYVQSYDARTYPERICAVFDAVHGRARFGVG